MWPLLAPTKNNLEEAKIPPLTAPNVEQATKKGMIQDMTPNNRFPKVWKKSNIAVYLNQFNMAFDIYQIS